MAAPIDPKRPDETLEQYIARIRPPDKPPEQPKFDPDLIPEETKDTRFDKEREEIDAVLGRIDIVDAYNKYCGKMRAEPGGKRESIMVRCPYPGHDDVHPSAWLTLDKGDGGVGNCNQDGGFDKYDLAAWHYGFDVPGYKTGINFPELRRRMAEGLGYTVMVAGKDSWLEKIQPEIQKPAPVAATECTPPTEIVTAPAISPEEQLAQPYDTHIVPTLGAEEVEGLDWRTLGFLPTTFLHTWMTETSRAHQPEEFFLFEGLAALGFAVGNKAYLDDETRVRANTMICLVGGTGTGKSRSVSTFNTLLREALPFHEDTGVGVRFIHSPGSGEDLVNQMIHFTTDPTTKEKTFYPIRGYWYEDEFEALMGKVNRMNSTLRSNGMKFYDSEHPVSKSSQTAGVAIAKDHFVQVITTTQPKRLGSLMTTGDATSGFLNRWLFVFGTEKFRPSISSVRLDLKASASLLQQIRAWSSPGREVHLDFDPVATDLWDHFAQNQIRPLEKTDELLVSRIELQCKKLLLLFAINDRSTMILEAHMNTLMQMFPYLKRCYGVVEKNVGVTELEDCVEAIRKYFASHPDDDITMRALQYQSAARKYDTYLRTKAMELLEKSGEIMQVPMARGTRIVKWRYIPDSDPPPQPLAPVIQLRP